MSRACKPTRDKPMSYILDALKRADAERERGAVPGLHARQLTTPAAQDTTRAQHRLWLAAAVATLVLVSIAAGLWFRQTPDGNARPAALQPAPTRPAAAASRPAVTTAAKATPKATPLPLEKATAPQDAAATLPLLSELSEDLRRDIPKLIITGTVYSDNPKQRLLLVNGQVLSQGSQAAPDVNVEEIRTKS